MLAAPALGETNHQRIGCFEHCFPLATFEAHVGEDGMRPFEITLRPTP